MTARPQEVPTEETHLTQKIPDLDENPENIIFASIDDVLADLKSVPGIDDGRKERQAARDKMDRSYKMSLAMVRQAAEYTQAEVADRMGVTQASVSRTEKRVDMLLSTLRSYLEAAGGEHARILVTVQGVEQEIELDALQQSDFRPSEA